jgi:hypothetical protein
MSRNGKLTDRDFLIIAIVMIVVLILALTAPEAEASSRSKVSTEVLLARSCVGEAGFDSVESGECAAILHVYKKRSELLREPVRSVSLRYSAAIKRRRGHPNPWVLHLRSDLAKPKRWSKRLKWSEYSERWEAAVVYARKFLEGGVDDPLPAALHYGGRMDKHRLSPRVWAPLVTPYKNIFYKRK